MPRTRATFRIRSIHPNMLTSARYGALSDTAEVTFVRLMLVCDDEGRTLGDLRLLKAWLFPVRDRVDLDAIAAALEELEEAGYLVRYAAEGRDLIQVSDWTEFQKPNRSTPSALPGPCSEESLRSHDAGRDLGVTGEGEGEGEGGVQGRGAHDRGPATPSRHASTRGSRVPDPFTVTPAMAQWANDRYPTVDVRHETEKFVDWFRSAPGAKGLKLDWPATWRNWIRRASEAKP